MAAGCDVAWIAEPSDDGALVLGQVRGDHTGLLRGLHVPSGLGLTGKVYACAHPAWVDDYFTSSDITHTYDWLFPSVKTRIDCRCAALDLPRRLGPSPRLGLTSAHPPYSMRPP